MPANWEEATTALNATIGYWRDWLSTAKVPDHPWRPCLERSALTLKGLSYAPTGAIMAASTTSLPETPGGTRNWDYRYTWIRDSAFMLRSLYRLGARDSVIGSVKHAIIARRGKEARNIAKVAAARQLLTLIFYGLRDGQIRCLSKPAGSPPPAQLPARAA